MTLYRPTLALALLLVTAAAARAQEPAPPSAEPARFLVETITVEGARPTAARIVEAESLLRPGESYAEADLRQAVARIHRLPFVLEVVFSLRKGSVRGAYELLIEVQQARWFFFERDNQLTFFDEPLALESLSRNETTFRWFGLIGARAFVGRSGVAFAGVSGVSLQAGYSHYDLFGRGILASVGYSEGLTEVEDPLPYGIDPNLAVWEWGDTGKLSLSLAVPLSRDDSFHFAWSDRRGQASARREVFGPFRLPLEPLEFIDDGELTMRRGEAKWVRDTSDDPLLPTGGFTLSAGLEYVAFEARELIALRFDPDVIDPPEPFAPPPFTGEQVTAAFSALRHRSLTPRQSVSAGGRLSLGRSRIENLPLGDGFLDEINLDVFGAALQARHQWRLWTRRGEAGLADLYLESGATAGVEWTSPDLATAHDPLERLELSTALVFRNEWGRIRLKLSFLDLGEVRP